jgi:LysR family hydrogen peroxide-inducible transcriptional activator
MATVNPPTLKQLRYLVALAEQGHFGRAAAACRVTQSTLSAGLQELESLLGAVLVDRTKRQVVFTPLGRDVVEHARRTLAEAESLVQAARSAQQPLTGLLRLGVIPTIGPYWLPKVLPGLRRAYPDLRLQLREDLTVRLCAQLGEGQLDVVLLALPYDCGNADTLELFREGFRFVDRADGPFGDARPIPAAALRNRPLLLLEDGHCLRDHALAACRLPRRAEGEAFAATSLHTLVQMAANGFGGTLLPDMAIEAGILKGTGLVAHDLEGERATRRIGLAWRRGTRRREEFALFGRAMLEVGRRGYAGGTGRLRPSSSRAT